MRGGAELHDGERRYAADSSVCNLAWFDRRLRPGESPLFDEQLTQQFFIRRYKDGLPQLGAQGSFFPLACFSSLRSSSTYLMVNGLLASST